MTRSLGYTASSLGNHEFDDGVVDLVKFATEVTPVYPLLACNLVRIPFNTLNDRTNLSIDIQWLCNLVIMENNLFKDTAYHVDLTISICFYSCEWLSGYELSLPWRFNTDVPVVSYGSRITAEYCDPDTSTSKLAGLPRTPAQSFLQDFLQSSFPLPGQPNQTKTANLLYSQNAPLDSWK